MTSVSSGHPLGGSAWMLLSYVATRVVGLGATAVLARILTPSDFGVVALALIILLTVGLIRELGLTSALMLIDVRRELVSEILTVLLIVGTLNAAVVVVLAAPLSSLFSTPRLSSVLIVLSPWLVLTSIAELYDSLLQRELAFRVRFQVRLTQAIVSAAVAIMIALAGGGLWSLVAGQLAAQAAFAVGAMVRSRYVVRPRLPTGSLRPTLVPARGLLAHGVLEHVQHNLDVGITGYVLGSRAVGLYSMALRLGDLPYAAFTEPVTSAAFPIFARDHRRGLATSELALELLTIVALFACPFGALASATAHPLIVTVFGGKWGPAAPALAVLGAWAVVIQIQAALGWFLTSTGRASVVATISGLIVLPLFGALVLAAKADGIVGVAWVMLGAAIVNAVLLMLYARSRMTLPLRRQLRAVEGPLVGCAGAWITAHVMASLLKTSPSVVALIFASATGAAVYLAVLRAVKPIAIRRGVAFLSDALRNLRSSRAQESTRPARSRG